MIIISVVSLIISFLLQGLSSNLFSYYFESISIFSTIYVLVNLVVLQEYYVDTKKFMILIVVVGLLMDIVYNSTAFLSVFVFAIIYYVNKGLKFSLPYNLVTVNLFSIVSIILYHLITFVFLFVVRFDNYSLFYLFKIIGCSLIMTVIYTSLLYYVIDHLFKKFDLKVIR